MPRDGTKTRTKILDAALKLSMLRGLAATSLDDVIAEAGITKGSFFYHFSNKQELATRLVDYFAKFDQQHFETLTERVENLSRDPLQQVLLLVGLVAEWFTDSGMDNPGCLFASFCYQSDLWTEDIRKTCQSQLDVWTDWVEARLKQAAKAHPPARKPDIHAIAEMFNGVFEGAFVLARTAGEPKVITQQLKAYRDYIELLFEPRTR
ncbi:MAG: TetR/AcrR family transcriptional regulator [Planctomycetota bacterium]